MRTVTFSDERVTKAVHERFVPVWKNRASGFHQCMDSTKEELVRKGLSQNAPLGILVTFFMTPDLQVLHYVAGGWTPESYLEQFDFAERAHRAATGQNGVEAFKQIHAARSRGLAAQLKSDRDTDDALSLGFECEPQEYLIDLHDGFASGHSGIADGHSPVWDEMGKRKGKYLMKGVEQKESIPGVPMLRTLWRTYRATDGFLKGVGCDF